MDILEKSSWIWTEEPYDRQQPIFVLFRKEFHCDGKGKLLGAVSADSAYRLIIDGEDVLDGPCKGNGEVTYYDRFDRELNAGEHWICAEVLHYPTENTMNASVWRTRFPGFWFRGTLEQEHGVTLSIRTDETWKCFVENGHQLRARNFLDALCIGEYRETNAETLGWTKRNFPAFSWKNAKPYRRMEIAKSRSPGNLRERPVPNLMRKKREDAKFVCVRKGTRKEKDWTSFLQGNSMMIPAGATEIVEVGLPVELTAYIGISVRRGKGTKLKLISSECYGYHNDGPGIYGPGTPVLPRKGDRTDFVNGYLEGVGDEFRITDSAEFPETIRTFFYRAVRFLRIEVETQEEAMELCGLSVIETGYPLQVKSHVKTSDPSHQGIWDISLQSLRCCMQDTYMDCPFYERKQYIQDARLEALYTYAVSGDGRLGKQALEMFRSGQRMDGLLHCCYPSVDPNVIPNFSLYFILMVHDYMMYFGEPEFLKRLFPHILQIFSFFEERIDPSGLYVEPSSGGLDSRYWCFVDWTDLWEAGVPGAIRGKILTFSNLLLAYSYEKAAEIAEYLGQKEMAGRWERSGRALVDRVKETCRDADGIFRDGPHCKEYSQHVQAMAVLAKATENEKKVLEAALTRPEMTPCSVSMLFYLFRALEKADLYEYTEQLWEPWRDMLRDHLSTCVENTSNKRSDCHAWGALALYELPAVVLGVRPGKPGFAETLIRPQIGYLTAAEGSVTTPLGQQRVSWAADGDDLRILEKVLIPDEI